MDGLSEWRKKDRRSARGGKSIRVVRKNVKILNANQRDQTKVGLNFDNDWIAGDELLLFKNCDGALMRRFRGIFMQLLMQRAVRREKQREKKNWNQQEGQRPFAPLRQREKFSFQLQVS